MRGLRGIRYGLASRKASRSVAPALLSPVFGGLIPLGVSVFIANGSRKLLTYCGQILVSKVSS